MRLVTGGWFGIRAVTIWLKDRTIQKIDGNTITVDSPITTAVEKEFGGGSVKLYSWPGRIANIGIENLRLESAFNDAQPGDEKPFLVCNHNGKRRRCLGAPGGL